MRRGDIVILDVPFSDRTGSKVRPALIVQDDDLNQHLTDTIIALITSSRRRFSARPPMAHRPLDTRGPGFRFANCLGRAV